MGYLLNFTDNFELAVILWPLASVLLTMPILALLYRRDGRLRPWPALCAYAIVLYALGIVCFTLYPLPEGDSGPGITYGIPPQTDPLGFIASIRDGGLRAVLQIVFNIVFFVPLGFILGRAFRCRALPALIIGFLVSLFIETAQLTGLFGVYDYAYRTFDVNDLMWNTGGCMLFYALRVVCIKLTFVLGPIAAIAFGVFYAVKRCMPYDLLPGDVGGEEGAAQHAGEGECETP